MSDGGKGSKPRPFSVDMNTFDSNWDKIFNKKKQEEKNTLSEKESEKDNGGIAQLGEQ